MTVRNKKRAGRSQKQVARKTSRKTGVRRKSKKTSISKISVLQESGLIGCLTGTGVTSQNYKNILRKE